MHSFRATSTVTIITACLGDFKNIYIYICKLHKHSNIYVYTHMSRKVYGKCALWKKHAWVSGFFFWHQNKFLSPFPMNFLKLFIYAFQSSSILRWKNNSYRAGPGLCAVNSAGESHSLNSDLFRGPYTHFSSYQSLQGSTVRCEKQKKPNFSLQMIVLLTLPHLSHYNSLLFGKQCGE